MAKKLTHPSLLSVIRAMNASVAPFFGVAATNAPLFDIPAEAMSPVLVTRETVRGTQAAAATAEAKRGVPNIQEVDFAALPPNTSALLVRANVLVTAKGVQLETVNDAEFAAAHQEFVTRFKEAGGYALLAERFVMNMLNGSMLFRNRVGQNIRAAVKAEDLVVEVAQATLAGGLRLAYADIQDESIRSKAQQLGEMLANALTGASSSLRLDVLQYVEMGEGQEVYPSQEMVKDQDKGQGRVLAEVVRADKVPQAAFHGRKILNAIKTIDTWYAPDAYKALPIEPFGVDQSAQAALREKGQDFYSLMVRMADLTEQLREGKVSPESLFVASVFLRGGVFSKKAE